MVCPKCETVLKDGETVCPICGTPVDTKSPKNTCHENLTSDQFSVGEIFPEVDIKHTAGSNLNLAVDAKNTSNARNTGNSSSVKQNISNKYNDNLKRQDISDSSNMSLPQNHGAMPNKEKKNSMRILTVITVLAIVIITTMIAICFVLMNQSSKKTKKNTADTGVKYTDDLQTNSAEVQKKTGDADSGLSKSADDASTSGNDIDADVTAEFFKAAAGDYTFASGAGGWATYLVIDENGRFEGSYHDSEMGASGDDYDATVYVSNFSGQLSNIEKISDLEYTAYVESIEYQDSIGDQEIKDRVLYVYTGAYGIEYGKTLHFYMKGSDTENINEHLIEWLAMPLAWGSDIPKTLPFNAFYNEEDDAGFFGNAQNDSAMESIG